MSKIPEKILKEIRARLWTEADRLGWTALSDGDKSACYERWITDDKIGGRISPFVGVTNVRVYIKDSIMKPYGRERLSLPPGVSAKLGLGEFFLGKQTYEKPHGVYLPKQGVVSWGLAKNWKDILMATFERAYRNKSVPYAAVLLQPSGKTKQPDEQKMIEDLAHRLGILHLLWV